MRITETLIKNMSGRNAFTVALTIIAIHLIVMMIYIDDNRLARRTQKRDAIVQKIVNITSLLSNTPVSMRSETVKCVNDPYLEAHISPHPRWPLQFKTISFWDIQQALRHQSSTYSLSLQLSSKPPIQWLNIRAKVYSHFLLTQLTLLTTELLIFSVMLVSLWFISHFTKPFRHFIEMAEQLGVDPNHALLPIDGPPLVRQASAAMNNMQQRIHTLIRERTQMLAAISHDLRTPLTRLHLRTQFIGDEELVRNMQSDISEMNSMIHETMIFARDDLTKTAKSRIDLISLIASICEDWHDGVGRIPCMSPLRQLPFLCHPIGIKRVMNNLLSNAHRYGKNVRVKIYRRYNKAYILVEDDGPGIPEGELLSVFAPFYRAEMSRNRNTGGMGLGLSVCKDIISAHGGVISLHNRKRGGLTVMITCPL